MAVEIVRRPTVLKMLRVSHATLWSMRQRGEFPDPVRRSCKGYSAGWLRSDVEAWLKESRDPHKPVSAASTERWISLFLEYQAVRYTEDETPEYRPKIRPRVLRGTGRTVYQVCYVDENGVRRAKQYPTIAGAQRAADDLHLGIKPQRKTRLVAPLKPKRSRMAGGIRKEDLDREMKAIAAAAYRMGLSKLGELV